MKTVEKKNKKKIMIVIGTRPQYSKMYTLMKTIQKYNSNIVIVHTGQHYDFYLAESFVRDFDFKEIKYMLGVGSGKNTYQIGEGVKRICKVIELENPNLIIVVGDSNPAIVGALGSIAYQIPLVHVEAGLRSGNLNEQEEINRIFIDKMANVLYCSTKENYEELDIIGSYQEKYIVGDLLCDSYRKNLNNFYIPQSCRNIVKNDYYIFTLHRHSNTLNYKILSFVLSMFSTEWDCDIIWPVHPGVLILLKETKCYDSLINISNLHLVNAVSYFEMGGLLSKCKAIITDSVGLQVEAYLHNKPSIIIRNEIEHSILEEKHYSRRFYPEDMDFRGCNQIVKDFCETYNNMVFSEENLFGEGTAAEKIANSLREMQLI